MASARVHSIRKPFPKDLSHPLFKRIRYVAIGAVLVIAAVIIVWLLTPTLTTTVSTGKLTRLRQWFADPAAHADWAITAGDRCGDAPMILPTNGYIGFGWGDSFRPGHRHSGLDIFSPDGQNNVTPVVAAYDGYLTREADWKSTVILRHPDFPALVSGEQIWTYYTHMASEDGAHSYIVDEFPPGTYEVFVEAGTVIGYQGNWSGNPVRPTGLHLHFSIVKSNWSGSYLDERVIENTYDSLPFLGLVADEAGIVRCLR